jgi:hypothetical protein
VIIKKQIQIFIKNSITDWQVPEGRPGCPTTRA